MASVRQPAQAGARFCYERHRPEETTLYRVVQEELETFLAQVEAQSAPGERRFGPMPRLHSHCEGGFLASERAVDRSEYGEYGASVRQTSFEIPIRPARNAGLPTLRPARVTLRLKDARQCTHSYNVPRRELDRPDGEDNVRAKFRSLAGLVLTAQGASALEAEIDRCEHWQSIDSLLTVLRRHGRT